VPLSWTGLQETKGILTVRRPFVIAHRFGNGLDALRDAERLGVPCVEADLRLFHGRVEVRHLKSVGPLPLFWDRWRVAAPWSPRLSLAELLRATGPQTELVLDLKGRNPALGRLVADAIEPHAAARSFIVCARSKSQLEPFEELPVRRFESVGNARQLRRLLRRGTAAHGVSIHARLLDESVVRQLRELTDAIFTWPVNRVDDAASLAALGVDGLISDTPKLLLAEGARA
jgi:glycerophosphoryl diester phosphodiesterase